MYPRATLLYLYSHFGQCRGDGSNSNKHGRLKYGVIGSKAGLSVPDSEVKVQWYNLLSIPLSIHHTALLIALTSSTKTDALPIPEAYKYFPGVQRIILLCDLLPGTISLYNTLAI